MEMVMGVHVRDPLLGTDSERSSVQTPPVTCDLGDDYELARDFGDSLTRAGDRLAGFVIGAGVLAAGWSLWLLISAILFR